jgi:hypothetical protein
MEGKTCLLGTPTRAGEDVESFPVRFGNFVDIEAKDAE